jgi:Mrp family chromosome partitioning ATPase
VISARPLSGRHIDHLGKLERVLQHATAFDLVLLDTAPLLLSADTTWLAGLADLTLVVVQASVTTRWEVKRTLTHLAASQPAAVGVVLNGVAVTEALFDRANVATEFAGATDAPVTTGSWWRRESA